jgi:hypothetical protein
VVQTSQKVTMPRPFVMPEEFAVAMGTDDLAQQFADRSYSRAIMMQGSGREPEAAAPAETRTDATESTAAASAPTATMAEAPISTVAATAVARADAPSVEQLPKGKTDIRERAATRKVEVTFNTIWDMPRKDNVVEEDFENFLKLVKTDADYGGSLTEPEKADEDLHNKLVIRLMAIMRHGSPLIPNPMWNYFAPLGRILSCIQQHKDFKEDSISEECLLCALMSADCHASVAGTPYFQTFVILRSESMGTPTKMVFARADPANAQVIHTINPDGFRLAASPYKQGGKKGGGGKANTYQSYQQPSGSGWSSNQSNQGSGTGNSNSWWKPTDSWSATGKDPWNTPAADK